MSAPHLVDNRTNEMTAVVATPVSHYKSRRKRQCGCCPYGYHIDTDFVRYCESVAEQRCRLLPRAVISRRPIHRASLPLLLGISSTRPDGLCIPTSDGPLDAAVRDFERALANAGGSDGWPTTVPVVATTVKPVVTAMVAPSKINNAATLPSTTSPHHLQLIRKQMASSLSEIKRLEEEVKQVPILQEQVERLRAERERLTIRLASLEAASTNLSSDSSAVKKRSISVGASVVTREVGVNHRQPVVHEAGVMTEEMAPPPPPRSDSLGITASVQSRSGPRTVTAVTQTLQPLPQIASYTQTVQHPQVTIQTQTPQSPSPPRTVDAISQTDSPLRLPCLTASTQTPPPILTGVSTQTPAPPRAVVARTQTVPALSSSTSTQTPPLPTSPPQPTIVPPVLPPQPVVSIPKTSVRTQTLSTISTSSSTQTPPPPPPPSPPPPTPVVAIHTQTDPPPEVPQVRRSTSQTQTLPPPRVTASHTQTIQVARPVVSTQTTKQSTIATGTQTVGPQATTLPAPPPPLVRSRSALSALTRRPIAAAAVVTQTSGTSRIPRPVRPPPSQRAFGRQLTYTVTPPTQLSFSAPSEGSEFDSTSGSTGAKLSQTFSSFPPTPATPSEDPYSWVTSPTVPASRPIKELGNEIKGALKVLNDGLKSADCGSSASPNIKSAIDVVQQEWFKITSDKSANPHNVEDLLDYCEELSSQLLHYVVNMSDNAGNTALHYAVSYENFDVVSVLLDSKVCDINKKNKVGYTPVMLLMLLEVKTLTDKHVVRRLLQLADVNIRAKNNGQTALMLAVSHDRIDNVEMLVEAGADVNIQDDDGNTALMVAAEYGLINMVKFLLAQPDCDLNVKDNDGNSALNVAVDCGNIDIGVLLYAQQHFSRGTSPSGSMKLIKSSTRTRTPTPTASPLPTRKFQD